MALLLKLALDHPVQIPAGICDEVIPFGQRVEFLIYLLLFLAKLFHIIVYALYPAIGYCIK